MQAELGIQSWAGLTWHPIEIVGETPQRFRVRHLDSAFRGPKGWKEGQVRLVPKRAVRYAPR